MDLHRRLLGTWRSDKRRTLRDFHRYQQLSAARKRRFGRLFGKLVLRYTRKWVHIELNGHVSKERYEVLGADADSIFIRNHANNLQKELREKYGSMFDDWFMMPKVTQLTFCRIRGRDYYWIGLGSYCEWFRKVR